MGVRKNEISSSIRPTFLATWLLVANLISACAYQSARNESLDSEGPEAEAIRNSKLGSGSSPYKSVQLPGVVQAEDFDNGGQSIAYADSDAGNNGEVYRSTDVDLTACSDTGGGYEVYNFATGEWLNYTVNVSTAGSYIFSAKFEFIPPAPALAYSPSSLSFGNVTVGSVSAVKTLTFTNSGTSNLILSAVKLAGDFQWGAATPTMCVMGNSYAPGASCMMAISFAPQTSSSLSGTLTVTDNAPNSPNIISLSGIGIAPAPSPAPAPAPTPVPNSGPAAPVPGITSFSGANGTKLYVDNFPFYVENANQPWSVSLVDSQTLRFELRPGDIWQNTNRSEIDGYPTKFPIDMVVDVYYDFLLEPGSTNTAAWFTIGDFHNDDNYTSGPLGIQLVNGDHMAVAIGSTSTLSDGLKTNFRYQNQNYGRAWVDPNPIQRNRYYAMHIQVKFNYNGNGFLNVWRDGIQIVSYRGSIGYNFGNGTYWKNGLYRAPAPETQAARYRNLVITHSP